jgi:hypothetical protein
MYSEAEKAKIELQVFADFVNIASLPIRISTVEKRILPEPDLLCVHDTEGRLAFELVELCDTRLARSLASAISVRSNAGEIEYIRTSDPTWSVAVKKLRKSYKTECASNLLCYTNGRIITPIDVIRPTLEHLLSSSQHKFTKAWLLSEGKVCSLWC